jgi:hypothetical protein
LDKDQKKQFNREIVEKFRSLSEVELHGWRSLIKSRILAAEKKAVSKGEIPSWLMKNEGKSKIEIWKDELWQKAANAIKVHAESKKLKVKKSLVFMFTITCKK